MKDIDFWLGGLEAQLASEDCGRDLAAVQNLLKKHQMLEADIAAHEVCTCNLLCDVTDSGDMYETVMEWSGTNLQKPECHINVVL